MPRYRDMRVRDADFQRFETLRRNREKRAKQGLCFLEGVHPIERAVEAGYEFVCAAIDGEKRLSGWAEDMLKKSAPETVFRLTSQLMAELSDREEPCEIIALIKQRAGLPNFAPQADSLYAVFDRPASPGNLGTVFRSADAFGARCVITTGHAADFYDPQCVRASIGTVFAKPHVNMGGCEECVEYLKNLPDKPLIVGTSAHGDALLSEVDLSGPIAMIIGNETFGMSKAWREACDVVAKIPICGAASSLNAGSAATVCFYEVARQRSFGLKNANY